MLTFYRCEKCRREFTEREDAEACENNHLTVSSARIKGYGIHAYPYEVEITFSNGESREYRAANMG